MLLPSKNPTKPSDFAHIPNPLIPGTYLLGHTHMVAADFPITSLWHRSFGKSGDIFLGILSVFLISVLWEIASAFILRTRRDTVSPSSLRAAYALDQLSRFRSLRALLDHRHRLATIVILAVTLLIFIADVVVVLVTQPAETHSTKYQYNLVAVQPVSTTRGRAQIIRRVVGDRHCVTPVIAESKQRRNFAIAACIHSQTHPPSLSYGNRASSVTVASWYHEGGSDHNVSYADAWHSVSVRANLFVEAGNAGGRHILFKTTNDPRHFFYLQKLLLHGAMERACKEIQGLAQPTVQCDQIFEGYKVLSRSNQTKTAVLWRGKDGDISAPAHGLVSTFRVNLPVPFDAINSGIRVLFTCAAITEVEGPATYSKVSDDTKEDGISGLITDDGRIAGIWLMSAVFGSLCLLMVCLRVKFRPTTLGSIAFTRTRGEEEIAIDKFEEEEKEMVANQNASNEMKKRNAFTEPVGSSIEGEDSFDCIVQSDERFR